MLIYEAEKRISVQEATEYLNNSFTGIYSDDNVADCENCQKLNITHEVLEKENECLANEILELKIVLKDQGSQIEKLKSANLQRAEAISEDRKEIDTVKLKPKQIITYKRNTFEITTEVQR